MWGRVALRDCVYVACVAAATRQGDGYSPALAPRALLQPEAAALPSPAPKAWQLLICSPSL